MCTSCYTEPNLNTNRETEQQSLIIKGPNPSRYSIFHCGARTGEYLKTIDNDATTLLEIFQKGAKASENGPCLGYLEPENRSYQWISYHEALLRAANFGSGLVGIGITPTNKTFIGIRAKNSPNWVIAEYALYQYSMVLVPIYENLGADGCNYIMTLTEMTTVIVDGDVNAEFLLKLPTKFLKVMISFSKISPRIQSLCEKKCIKTFLMDDLEVQGSNDHKKYQPCQPSDLALICFTSGTTGAPKGVMLTHENIVSSAASCIMHLGEETPRKTDCMMSYLPMSFMMERISQVAMFSCGGAVGFSSGNIKKLTTELQALRPTILPAVPKVLNRLLNIFTMQLKNRKCFRGKYKMAMNKKMSFISRGLGLKTTLWDRSLFKETRMALGGNLRLMIVGSAPLSGTVLTFIRCALHCTVLEGYGQTEGSGPCTLTFPNDFATDHVGAPLPSCQIKLIDVPEMEYYAASGQGEICIKGSNVFKGYFKNQPLTDATLDKDGWLKTGDIGEWMQNGVLRIIDRRKHIFKLAHGEYVAPEKVEQIYNDSKFVSQCYVHGESIQSWVVGIVVPNPEQLKRWAAEYGIHGTLSQLCYDAEIKKALLQHLQDIGTKAGLKTFEQVKDIYMHPDPFSVTNGLLSPNFKYKRTELSQYFKPQIEDMYSHVVTSTHSLKKNKK